MKLCAVISRISAGIREAYKRIREDPLLESTVDRGGTGWYLNTGLLNPVGVLWGGMAVQTYRLGGVFVTCASGVLCLCFAGWRMVQGFTATFDAGYVWDYTVLGGCVLGILVPHSVRMGYLEGVWRSVLGVSTLSLGHAAIRRHREGVCFSKAHMRIGVWFFALLCLIVLQAPWHGMIRFSFSDGVLVVAPVAVSHIAGSIKKQLFVRSRAVYFNNACTVGVCRLGVLCFVYRVLKGTLETADWRRIEICAW